MSQPVPHIQPDYPRKGAIIAFFSGDGEFMGFGRILLDTNPRHALVECFGDNRNWEVPWGNLERRVIARSDVYATSKAKSPPRHPTLKTRIARHIGIV